MGGWVPQSAQGVQTYTPWAWRVTYTQHAHARHNNKGREGDALVRPSTVRDDACGGLTEARPRCSNHSRIAAALPPAALPAWLCEQLAIRLLLCEHAAHEPHERRGAHGDEHALLA